MPIVSHIQQKYQNPLITAQTKMERNSSEEHKYMPQQKSQRNSFDKHISRPNINSVQEVEYGANKSDYP